MVKKPKLKLSDEIRQAMEGCGLTRYRISAETGIDNATLSRFASGERGLPMKTLDTLAEFLDLHITTGKRSRPTRKPSKKGQR
ncbi:MAG: helix-turn-helix transcriptional regulator [Planctomycetaceae bacterium]